jgi:hypothetical protein
MSLQVRLAPDRAKAVALRPGSRRNMARNSPSHTRACDKQHRGIVHGIPPLPNCTAVSAPPSIFDGSEALCPRFKRRAENGSALLERYFFLRTSSLQPGF